MSEFDDRLLAPAQATARVAARILLELEAVNFRPDDPFTLTSGRKSPTYIDCRKLISFPNARATLMRLMVKQLERDVGFEAFDAIAGGETAGIPFAAWIAERLSLPMLYVRKKPKGFGRDAQIEGAMQDGWRVLLVEDLATDGGSKLNFVDAIEAAGGRCAHCAVIFHYGIFPDGLAKLNARGIHLHALATWADVIAEAREDSRFEAATLDAVQEFLDDPEGWSAARE